MKKIITLLLFFAVLAGNTSAQENIVNGLINQGIKLHDKGDYTGAIDLYKKALMNNPRSAHANYELASSYLSLKDYRNAIKYADRVLAANAGYLDQAYILKGTALDLSGRPSEAIKTYKKALQQFSANHLLYYNFALTSFNLKQYKDAELALQKALKIDPYHASSHLLLGNTMIIQDKRVKGILALYNFLLLEPRSNRTTAALNAIEDQFKKGNKRSAGAEDEFLTAELMLGILESANKNEVNKNKTWHARFAEKTDGLFQILGDLKKGKDFWWNFYVDYFTTLAANQHSEAFSYYITQSKDDVYTGWMQANLTKMEAFSEWYTKYLHKF